MKKIVVMIALFVSIFGVGIFSFLQYSESHVLADSQIGSPVLESNIFDNFSTWRKGKIKDFDGMYIFLKSFQRKSVDALGNVTVKYENAYVDVNNDNLPDLVVVDYNKVPVTKKGDTKTYYEYQYFYGLLLTTGDFTYQTKYRCVYINNEVDASRTGYYGDCVRF